MRRSRAEVDAIIKRIRSLMARVMWTTAARQQMADELGVTDDMVRRWAATASRLQYRTEDDEDLEVIRRATLARLQALSERAEERGQFHAAVSAMDKVADISGMKVPAERRVNIVLEGLRGSDEWQRLRTILTRAAIDFVDERDRERLLAAIDEFESA